MMSAEEGFAGCGGQRAAEHMAWHAATASDGQDIGQVAGLDSWATTAIPGL